MIECNLCGSKSYEIVYKRGIKKGCRKSSAYKHNKDSYAISEADIQKPQRILRCNVCGLIFSPQGKNARDYVKKYRQMVDEDYVAEESGRRQACQFDG